MFGRKIKYELVKFSENDKYRVTMLHGKDGYIVFVNDVRDNHIGLNGAVKMTKEEADCVYNKECFSLGIGEMLTD